MSAPNVDGVLDLTFLDIRDEAEFQTNFTQKLEAYNRPASPSKTRLAQASDSPAKTFKLPKEPIKAIRLGNNYLTSMEVIHSIPAQIDSSRILWLDLSFNFITTLSGDLSQYFPNVVTIYLHANKISKLSELKKLAGFQHLRALSLYGNPVEENKHYRNYVLFHCTALGQFDKSPVTKSQIQKVSTLVSLIINFIWEAVEIHSFVCLFFAWLSNLILFVLLCLHPAPIARVFMYVPINPD
ncbi:hypothetical protein EON63_11925 [archaeon]|nr:MAG: hypothetical protein EON63_11925 [archaeon]